MSLDLESRRRVDPDQEPIVYREMCTSAVASLVLGLLSLVAIPSAMNSLESFYYVAPIGLVGAVLGLAAIVKISRLPAQLAGMPLAATGLALSLVSLFGGAATGAYVYVNEVPPGTDARVHFTELKPHVRRGDPEMGIPEEVLKLEGKKVFIKGYMRPPAQSIGIDSFLLVRDNNQCCFGPLDSVKYYDQVQVRLLPPLRTEYSNRLFRVRGTLRLNPLAAYQGAEAPAFLLDVDYLK